MSDLQVPCPRCGQPIAADAILCQHCNRYITNVPTGTGSVAEPRAIPRVRVEGARSTARVVYGAAAVCAIVGGGLGLVGFASANGAPQEAAAAAFGVLCCVGPYVFARCVDEMTR